MDDDPRKKAKGKRQKELVSWIWLKMVTDFSFYLFPFALNPMSDTPHSLLEQLNRRPDDSLAWGRLVRLYSPFLKKWANRWTGLPEHDIDDLVQNVLSVV